jgi:hypothetical protein
MAEKPRPDTKRSIIQTRLRQAVVGCFGWISYSGKDRPTDRLKWTGMSRLQSPSVHDLAPGLTNRYSAHLEPAVPLQKAPAAHVDWCGHSIP